MTVLRLRTDTEAAMIAACPLSFRYTDENGAGQWRTKGDGFDLKIHGAWCMQNAMLDNSDPDNPKQVSPPVWDERFHMDVVCDDDVAAQIPDAIKIYPVTPGHTFQGVEG